MDEVVVLGANSELEELIVTVANIPKSNLYLRLILRPPSERIKRIPNVKGAKVSRSRG